MPLLPDIGSLLPLAFAGSLFDFFKPPKQPSISASTLQAINNAVRRFMESRGVENFKVYTIAYEDHPIVLIQAQPQKKLRFSNILEIQIKKFIREQFSAEVPAIFWRFKTDYSEEPGPEQADYDFEEHPRYPQDREPPAAATEAAAVKPGPGEPAKANENNEEFDIHHLTAKGIDVHEISMGEFDEFLKGTYREEKEKKEKK